MYDPAARHRRLNLPEAIAREEGWNLGPQQRCRRNHNPGNVEFGQFAELHGAHIEVPEPGHLPRFAACATDEAGFALLVALCRTPKYRGNTVAQLIERWAPSTENNTSSYLRNVCAWTELQPTDVIDGHLDPFS